MDHETKQPQPDSDWCRSVLDTLPAAIYATNAAGRITYYNETAAQLAGRRPQIGKDKWCVSWRLYRSDGTPLPHDQCPMAIALKENRAVRGEEAILERPDGTRTPFLPFPTPLRDASGKLVGAVNLLLDISERKAAEEARAYLAAIVDCSDDAIVSKSLGGIVQSWNRGAETIFGYRADEIVGRPISMLFPPDRIAEEDVILSRIQRGERVDHFETIRRRKDGQDIDISVTISPVRDPMGRIVGASKIARDVTEKKLAEAALRDLNENLEHRVKERTRELSEALERERAQMAERERAEAALRHAQKMEAVGQLASGMAHDFNNLLTSIVGNLELLDIKLADERLRKLVQAAMRSAQRGAKLNEQMLAFSRKQYLAPQSVDVNGLIHEVEHMLHRTLGPSIQVSTCLAPGLWTAFIDPHQLELVILNLAINARDAMPVGGRLLIETEMIKAKEVDSSLGLSAGDYVRVSVADTGTGMSEEVLARACEPFYTTKEVGKGTGLGLAQVYGVARQSGGGIRIRSTLGEGTTVEVYLPRSLAVVAARGPLASNNKTGEMARRPTVLVVDDQPDVREVAVAQLEALGCRVVEAASGQAALKVLETTGSIDLLMVDLAMPGMSGADVARAGRAKHTNLPVLLVTGYADAGDTKGLVPRAGLLRKPYRMAELAVAVEDVLRAREIGDAQTNVFPLRGAQD